MLEETRIVKIEPVAIFSASGTIDHQQHRDDTQAAWSPVIRPQRCVGRTCGPVQSDVRPGRALCRSDVTVTMLLIIAMPCSRCDSAETGDWFHLTIRVFCQPAQRNARSERLFFVLIFDALCLLFSEASQKSEDVVQPNAVISTRILRPSNLSSIKLFSKTDRVQQQCPFPK